MKKSIYKFSCFLLAVLIFFGNPAVKAFASVDISMQEIEFPTVNFFGTNSVPEPVDSKTVERKIAKIRELKGKYFTVNKTYCNKIPGETVHGCDNCESTNLIKTNLYDLMPESRSCLPEYHRNTGGISKLCWSCAAFASITHWYIYAGKSTDAINVKKISSGTFSEETLSSAKPGDIIALSYASTERHFHSMIFLGHTSTGISVIDCNWNTQTYGNCVVLERNVSYSEKYTVAVSRASNYSEDKIPVEGIEITDSESNPLPENIELYIGEKIKLNAAVKPENASEKTVFWSSGNPLIAEVLENGEVFGISEGNTEIKAVTKEGGFSDSVIVNVIRKNYNVDFKSEEEAAGIPEPIISNGNEFTVPEDIPSLENRKFLHWSDGENTFEPGKSYEISEDKTLFAVWVPDWHPQIETKNIYAAPGEEVAVSVFVTKALEPENTEIDFSLECDELVFLKKEITEEIPEEGIIGTYYFSVPESLPEGEYIFEIKLEKYLVSGFDLSENVKMLPGRIFISKIRLGDVDGNGKINILDANLIRRYSARTAELDEKQQKAADVDGSGKINILDASLIRRYSAKLIDSFPAEQNID
ncbi:MAG: Ig-like domain-containing protein [Oscillospiraceae bacterium]|nr:Ig-like domain-containing protein [Oscillospiraceae bacterium]